MTISEILGCIYQKTAYVRPKKMPDDPTRLFFALLTNKVRV